MEAKRYLFKFYYIALRKYFGSQRQKERRTIEECIINALCNTNHIISAENSNFEVGSRTDRFVSARGSALSFISIKKPILMEINSVLPKEIGFWAYTQVPIDFLSRFNALYRHYKYIIPITKGAYINEKKLDIKLMRNACKALEGYHDFKNFYKRGKEEVNTIRDLISASLSKEHNFLIFDFKSQAFLRQQIRRMVSKLLEIGIGKIDFEYFSSLFNSNLDISYEPSDPKGLILYDIYYGNNINFKVDSKSVERMKMYFFEQKERYKLKYKLFSVMQQYDISN